LEASEVGDSLARLDRKRERLRNLSRPFCEHVFLRKRIERVVDLDRRKLARVKAEHSVVFQVLRIERAFPLFEREPARSRVQLHEGFRPPSSTGFAAE